MPTISDLPFGFAIHPDQSMERKSSFRSVSLRIIDSKSTGLSQPVTVGIPFPRGMLKPHDPLRLLDSYEQEHPLQTQPLRCWDDGSVQWLLMDTILPPNYSGSGWKLQMCPPYGQQNWPRMNLSESEDTYIVNTGEATFYLHRSSFPSLLRVLVDGNSFLGKESNRLQFVDHHGVAHSPIVERTECESVGPVRATIRYEGGFDGSPCRFVARYCFFAGTGFARIQFTLHNPQRAKHPGGLWDLGDTGSVLFRELSLQFELDTTSNRTISWTTDGECPVNEQQGGCLEIYQDSSGGVNWQSKNHVNRDGQVAISFRGYRVRSGSVEQFGERASPVVSLRNDVGQLGVAIPEFWQQFPKAIETNGTTLRLALFPSQAQDLFEIQGGERKSHTMWLQFNLAEHADASDLRWVHHPARIQADPEWYQSAGVFPCDGMASQEEVSKLDALLNEVVSGESSVFARRECVDEYGWRHFGEVYADHEGEHYNGPPPVISHYNNQYDQIYGALLQYIITGDPRWYEFFDPLARHVMDIDIYHTTEDRSAYNGGLFWLTDHYVSAETSTHRTYSKSNCPGGGQPYGGGPSSNHLFTTGLMHYYFLTGDINARDAVLTLADWVIRMDDGRTTVFGLIDGGPTGLASMTGTEDYHGPGRGGGNSINALMDGWLVSGCRTYLDKAEELIRRCIHPKEDMESRDLLNVEKRWSYTMFLRVLDRYLKLKAEMNAFDFSYEYARASLIHYAKWMLENECPYFDHPEQLEYPTETWAGQEFRKGNVLRLAASYVNEPLRSRLWQKGLELSERAWHDLMRFETRTSARSVALILTEGVLDVSLRTMPTKVVQPVNAEWDFGEPQPFVPQKQRVLAKLKSVNGIGQLLVRMSNPVLWWKAIRFISKRGLAR